MRRNDNLLNERGGVSIFIVIFTALMITVVAASFTQIMLRAERQSSTSDLSQSAYDSALAGVEDAKRALIALRKCTLNGNCPASLENAFTAPIESQSCEVLDSAGVVDFVDGEVQVGKEDLNQAYTCVKVELNTDSYVDETFKDMPVVIPLRSTESFDRIRISWFNHDDFEEVGGAEGGTPEFPQYEADGPPPLLPPEDEWTAGSPNTSPALMRAQLIQFPKGNINLGDFNDKGTKNARTLFLYPSSAGASNLSFAADARSREGDAASNNEPHNVQCGNFTYDGGFACQVTITLPDMPNREAYLQLQTMYQSVTSYKVELCSGSCSSVVKFNNVQPRVDSTGRASDLFRRVRAHVSLRNKGVPLQYPDAALSVEDGVCKNFFVTDDKDEYNRRADTGC